MPYKIGALFAGYGGLDMAVEAVLPAEVSWVSEIDKAPSAILAKRYPDAPNLGDVTQVDWSKVEPVDIITGGSPCQDLSQAGKRLGMKKGTRSGLWVSMREAIRTIKPQMVIWENVGGAFSAEATSEMEECPRCVGDGSAEPILRALGRVLGDLTEIGYDAEWHAVRAADVGAPHHRLRVFVVGYPAGERGKLTKSVKLHNSEKVATSSAGLKLLPTPTAHNSRESGKCRNFGSDITHAIICGCSSQKRELLPTPTTMDSLPAREGEALSKRLKSTGKKTGRRLGTGNLREEIFHVTPKTGDSSQESLELTEESSPEPEECESHRIFGQYAPAIAKWEEKLGRPAPAPTHVNEKTGKEQLSPAFVEFMMGLPAGWVTSPDIGLSRAEQLTALGNGVVPQQAALVIRHVLTREVA